MWCCIYILPRSAALLRCPIARLRWWMVWAPDWLWLQKGVSPYSRGQCDW